MSDLEAYRAVEQFAVFDVLGVRTHWSVMIGHKEIWGLDFWLSKRNYLRRHYGLWETVISFFHKVLMAYRLKMQINE